MERLPLPVEVTDPVCGASLTTGDDGDSSAARGRLIELHYMGRHWFFCSGACRLAFKRAPQEWMALRPDAGVVLRRLPPAREREPSPFTVRTATTEPPEDG